MGDMLIKAVGALPTLRKPKKPGVAAAIGFLFGGIGLGLYFRSFIDFLLPLAAAFALVVTSSAIGSKLASVGWLGGAALVGVYGFFRAQDSNRRLAMQVEAAAVPMTA
jgi:hypothetical protein